MSPPKTASRRFREDPIDSTGLYTALLITEMTPKEEKSIDAEIADQKRKILWIGIALSILVVCLAFPVLMPYLKKPEPPKVEAPVVPTAEGVGRLAVQAPLLPDLQPQELSERLSSMLASKSENLPELRRLARLLAGAPPEATPRLLSLVEFWNHPALFEALEVLGQRGTPVLRHLESLMDYLDTVCADDRLGKHDKTAPKEESLWLERHVTCAQQSALRKGAQNAWLSIKQTEGYLYRKEGVGSSGELSRALVSAVRRERMTAIKQLLSVGAYVNGVGGTQSSDDGTERSITPLMAAVDNESTVITDLLLQVGGDVNFRVWYPLNEAIRLKNHARIEFFLQHGATLNRQDGTGEYPLTLAAKSRDLDLVKLLLKHGANPYLRNDHGKSAREMALLEATPELLAVIDEAIDTNGQSVQ